MSPGCVHVTHPGALGRLVHVFFRQNHRTPRSEVVTGARESLERVRAATVCRRAVCPLLEDTRRELGLLPPLPAPLETSMLVAWLPPSQPPPPYPAGVERVLSSFALAPHGVLQLLPPPPPRWSLSLVLFELVTSPNLPKKNEKEDNSEVINKKIGRGRQTQLWHAQAHDASVPPTRAAHPGRTALKAL